MRTVTARKLRALAKRVDKQSHLATEIAWELETLQQEIEDVVDESIQLDQESPEPKRVPRKGRKQ